jgi:hypothetical protein
MFSRPPAVIGAPRGLPPGITQEMLDEAKAMKAVQSSGGKLRAYGRNGILMRSSSRSTTYPNILMFHTFTRGSGPQLT